MSNRKQTWKAAVSAAAICMAANVLASTNLVQNGTFEATDGTSYKNNSWAYSNQNGGKPQIWTYTSGGCGLINQSSGYNHLGAENVGTHSFFFERSGSAARELQQTFTIPARGVYKYFWNYTNWSSGYGGAQAIAEIIINGETGQLAAFMPSGRTNPGLLSISGTTNLTESAVDCTLQFRMPAGASTSGSSSYFYNVIDNVSFSLDTLVVTNNESFVYDAALDPNSISIGTNATLTIAAADGVDGVPGTVTFGEGARLVFDVTGFEGDVVVFRTGGFSLPDGAGDVLSFIELAGEGAANFAKFLVEDGRTVVLVSPTAPFRATWNGGGNWTCETLSGETLSSGTEPSDATFFITLAAAADWRGGVPQISPHAVCDMAGFGLAVPGLDAATFAVAAITNSGAAADLRVTVDSGTSDNTSVSIGGAIRLVKDGAGTLVASKAGQTYTGGSKLEAGVLKAGANGGESPFGAHPNLVRNGTFEDTSYTAGSWSYTKNISGRIPGWTASDNTGLFPAKAWWGAAYTEQNYGLFFEGTSSASQTFTVSKPGRYRIRFGYGPWTGSSAYPATTLTMTLTHGGASVYSTSVTPTKGVRYYTWVDDAFVVDEAGDYTLSLSTKGSGYVYCVIDDLEIVHCTELEVGEDATLDMNGKTNFRLLHATLAGGTLANTGADAAYNAVQIGAVSVPDEGSSISLEHSYGLVAYADGATLLDIGAYGLAVSVASGKSFWLDNTTITGGPVMASGAGTLAVSGKAVNAAGTDFTVGCALNLGAALNVRNYTATYAGAGNGGTAALNVNGVFRPEGSGFYAPTMQDGSTLDFSQWAGALPLAGVKFASGASVTVSIGSNAAVCTFAKAKDENGKRGGYLVTWEEMPDATFTLDAASCEEGFRIKPDSTGLKVSFRQGLTIIIK